MNKTKMALVLALALGSTACVSNGVKETPQTAVADCVFPNTEQAAPGWICDEPQPGLEIQAVGVAEPSKAGISFVKDMAVTDARARIAEQLKVQVSKIVKKYLGRTGTADNETIDAAAESATKSISNETLVGTRIYKTRTGPTGRYYALVGIDSASVEQAKKTSIISSMKNDNALWQKFQSQKLFDELAAEIAKQPAD